MATFAIDATHEVEMTKRIRILKDDLKPYIDEITSAILANSQTLIEMADRMVPPVPFILVDEIQSRHHLPSMGLLMNSALRHTIRNLESVSQSEWVACFDEYCTAASGKGKNNPADELVFVDDAAIAISDKIGQYLDPFFSNYKEKNGQTAISYARVSGKTSHKIIAALAIIYTARYLVAERSKQN